MSTLHRTIVRPIMTEKTSAGYQARGEYTFEVASDANKAAIRQAIERLFGVKVTGVWTANVRGKLRKVGKTSGRRPNWKKAIVKLRSGDTIDVFEG
jgi:large subunit ribosomal protein L23